MRYWYAYYIILYRPTPVIHTAAVLISLCPTSSCRRHVIKNNHNNNRNKKNYITLFKSKSDWPQGVAGVGAAPLPPLNTSFTRKTYELFGNRPDASSYIQTSDTDPSSVQLSSSIGFQRLTTPSTYAIHAISHQQHEDGKLLNLLQYNIRRQALDAYTAAITQLITRIFEHKLIINLIMLCSWFSLIQIKYTKYFLSFVCYI